MHRITLALHFLKYFSFCSILFVLYSGVRFELLYFPYRAIGIGTFCYDCAITLMLCKPLIISTSKLRTLVALIIVLQPAFHLDVHCSEVSMLAFNQLNHIPFRNEYRYYSQISNKILRCALSILLMYKN